MTPEMIKGWLEEGLPTAKIKVEGDGQHFEALIIYSGFENKTILQQHRLVYDVLGDKMANEIHALSLKTFTPEQANLRNIIHH